jgi:uncharacterized protein YuzE
MRLHVDQEADALYLRLDDSKIIESQEVFPGVVREEKECLHILLRRMQPVII